MKPASSPVQAQPAPTASTDDQTKPNRNYISNRYLKAKPSAMTATKTSPPAPTDVVADVAQKMVAAKPKPAEQPAKKSSGHKVLSEAENRIVTESLLKTDEFWILPLSQSTRVRFIFTVDNKSGPGPVFRMITENSHDVILTAEMNGPSRTSGMSIQFGKHPVGSAKFITGNQCFFAGVKVTRGLCEAGAAVYNSTYTSPNDPRIFDFLIPALKKIDGRSRMFPVLYADVSGLVTRASQLSKEAIRLKTRIPPKNNSGDWDMTFSGKLANQSLSNFEIYHDSDPDRTYCQLSLRSPNEYALSLGYPLSPLQGFIAAVAATMPRQ